MVHEPGIDTPIWADMWVLTGSRPPFERLKQIIPRLLLVDPRAVCGGYIAPSVYHGLKYGEIFAMSLTIEVLYPTRSLQAVYQLYT